jgi:hypothetical protein
LVIDIDSAPIRRFRVKHGALGHRPTEREFVALLCLKTGPEASRLGLWQPGRGVYSSKGWRGGFVVRNCFGIVVTLMGLSAMALACGDADRLAPVSAPPPTSIDGPAVSGIYAVHGITVQAQSGSQREIDGTLALDVQDVRYTVSFELATTAPDLDGNVPVRVVGDGRGLVVGETLTGTTEEWMTLVPPEGALEAVEFANVDLPKKAGRKLVSTSHASFDEDGSFEIVLQNFPGPGEDYEPSMTVLTGKRIGAAAADPRD